MIKINSFMFDHDPQAIWNEIQKSCTKAADDWLSNDFLAQHYINLAHKKNMKCKMDAKINHVKDHPFIIYLKQNNIGELKDWKLKDWRLREMEVYTVKFTEILPEADKLYESLYYLQIKVIGTFQRKVVQYGVGDGFEQYS